MKDGDGRAGFLHGAYAARMVVGFCLVLIALLWTGAIVEIGLDRERTADREMETNASLVRALDQDIDRILGNADQVALFVKRRFEREGGRFDLLQYVRDGNIGGPSLDMVGVADQSGRVVRSSTSSGPVNVADKEYFQFHLQQDTKRLFVSRPERERSTGKWTIYLTRRIANADGSFGGVSMVGLDTSYLAEIFRAISLDRAATITLLGLDGTVRARRAYDDDTPGQNVRNIPLLTRRVRESDRGSYITVSSIDHVTRILSYKLMRSYPLVVLIGTSEADALKSAERRSTTLLAGAGIASLAILLFAARFATQSRRRSRAGQRHQRELERQVELRTASLTKANEDLEAFAYSVSHDLRTPLRAIAGFAQILARRQRERLDEQGRHYLDNIVDASGHMGRLIDELLNYSRLGRHAVRLGPVALANVFTRIARELEPRIESLGASLRLPSDPPVVQGEEVLLYQIFLNMIDNALHYCRPGSAPVVEVSFQPDSDGVTFAVRDEGVGIEPAHFETIFGVFQRLQRQDDYPGTGIGLATVRRAVDMLGGRVWVESAPGQGSTFFVRLNRIQGESSGADTPGRG